MTDNGRVTATAVTRDEGPREVVLLGSTGSIGTQALDVVRRNPDRFRVVGLGAGGGRVGDLAVQALEFGAEVIAVSRASALEDLQLALYAHAQPRGYARGDLASRRSWPARRRRRSSRSGPATSSSTG